MKYLTYIFLEIKINFNDIDGNDDDGDDDDDDDDEKVMII